MRVANLALKFLLELAAFAAFAYAGVSIGSGGWAVVLGVLFPVLAIAVWGRWNAPRSAHRLPTARRIGCELTVFAVAAVLLAAAGAPVLAGGFAALVVVNAVLLQTLHQWES